MGRFNIKDVDNYGGGGGGGFFSLKNDRETARVRFLYDSDEDIEGFAVHEPKIDGKKRYVNCIRDYNEPKDVCPFCAANMHQRVKVFIPLYNIEEDQVQIWDRGKQFLPVLTGTLSRYNDDPIVAQEFEVERQGKPKDTNTTYGIYRTKTPTDDTTLDDFEMPQVVGTIVLEKTADEMEHYLKNGVFPQSGNATDEEDEAPIRRRSERRTPASNRRDRDDF